MIIYFSDKLDDIHNIGEEYNNKKKADQIITDDGGKEEEEKIKIFYNLYIASPEDEERVRLLVEEQLSFLDISRHSDILYTSIGHRPKNVEYGMIREYQEKGTEGLTLHALWEYCKANPYHERKVIYLHSKGSFHDHDGLNSRLRQFLTRGALSEECSNLPDKCNICSSRMSPIPHPHVPGNMFLARCDYIAQLINPITDFADKSNPYPKEFSERSPCKGWGRYFFEHWVGSHPSAMPCDLYTGKEYLWGYLKVPDPDAFEIDLQIAPFRFLGAFSEGLYGRCRRNIMNGISQVEDRIWQYEMLYQTRPDKLWWGWDFYDVSYKIGKDITFT